MLHTGFLQSWGAGVTLVTERGLRSTGSVVGAHGLRCPMGCGLFLVQGLNLYPRVLDPWAPGKPHASFLEGEVVDAESRVLQVWCSPACLLRCSVSLTVLWSLKLGVRVLFTLSFYIS